MNKEPVIANVAESKLIIPHIGITLRVLLAAANNANPDQHVWRLIYKNTDIGRIKIKTSNADV